MKLNSKLKFELIQSVQVVQVNSSQFKLIPGGEVDSGLIQATASNSS
jgi:hypothetical protein